MSSLQAYLLMLSGWWKMQDAILEHSSCKSLWWVDTSQQQSTPPLLTPSSPVPAQSLTNETYKINLQASQFLLLRGIYMV